MSIAKTSRFSKKVPRSGVPVIDTIITVIQVASAAKDIYDWFNDDKKK